MKTTWIKTEEASLDIDTLVHYGFAEDRCHRCGIHNSEISGLLMQCGKCKKAYYCSMKCFNDDLSWHQQFCQTSRIDYAPSLEDATKIKVKLPPRISLEPIGENLYKIKATHHQSILATDASGHTYKPNLDDGTIFSYTKGKSHEKRGTVDGHKDVRKLYGSGPLTLTVDNGNGKTVSVTVDPAEAGPPKLKIEEIRPGLYKIVASDQAGFPVTIKGIDSAGNTFQNLEPGSFFTYDKAWKGSHQEQNKHVQQLAGQGALRLTAVNVDGKETTIEVTPSEPTPPKIKVQNIAENLYKLKVKDPAVFHGPLEITAKDSDGCPITLKNNDIFSYVDAGSSKTHQQPENDEEHGAFQKIRGHGNLTITVVNSFGKEVSAFVSPGSAPPPSIHLESLKDGYYRIHASDPNDELLTIQVVDHNGDTFLPGLENASVFSYTDAGSGSNQQTAGEHPSYGSVKKLRGHGQLTVTVTSASGKTAQALIEPAEAPPPVVNIHELETGVYRLEVSDESGNPVTILAVDSERNTFNNALADQSIFRYEEAGKRFATQEIQEDSRHGGTQKIRGKGDLTITAINSAGKERALVMKPTEADPPSLRMEDLGDGFFKVIASDGDGEPVIVEAADQEGNAFAVEPGTIFRYEVAGKLPVSQETREDGKLGSVEKMFGSGNLTFKALNAAGKESILVIQPTESDPPSLNIEDLGEGFLKVIATDRDGEPVTVRAADQEGNAFILESGTIFRYDEAGKRSASQDAREDERLGSVQKICGRGNLTVTVVNYAGKETSIEVKATDPDPPTLRIEDLGDGLRKIIANDKDGGNVVVTAYGSKGYEYTAKPDMIFRFLGTDGDAGQTYQQDANHGDVSNFYGEGELMFTATSASGKQATAKVQATESDEPKVELVEVESGVFTISAIDPNGDPLTVHAEDGNGNSIVTIPVKATFRYADVGPVHSKKDGDVYDFQMPELWITCYNKAGKKKKIKVNAPEKKQQQEPSSPKPPAGSSMKSGVSEPDSPSKRKKRILTREVRDKLIFWYGRLGYPTRDEMIKKVARLPESCGIRAEDVELLPWIMNGRMIRTKDLHDKVLENTTVYIEKEVDSD